MTRIVLVFAAFLLFEATPPAAAESTALLKESGVKGGLIVHLGCGDGKLAALRVNERFLVQGLEADTAKIEQARANGRPCLSLPNGRVACLDGK